MATFISLATLTDQGIRNIRESPDRFEAFRALGEKLGVTVKSAYYTSGRYDLVLVVEGPEEATMAAMLKVGSLGNVRTEALRAYSVAEMRQIIAAMP